MADMTPAQLDRLANRLALMECDLFEIMSKPGVPNELFHALENARKATRAAVNAAVTASKRAAA